MLVFKSPTIKPSAQLHPGKLLSPSIIFHVLPGAAKAVPDDDEDIPRKLKGGKGSGQC